MDNRDKDKEKDKPKPWVTADKGVASACADPDAPQVTRSGRHLQQTGPRQVLGSVFYRRSVLV